MERDFEIIEIVSYESGGIGVLIELHHFGKQNNFARTSGFGADVHSPHLSPASILLGSAYTSTGFAGWLSTNGENSHMTSDYPSDSHVRTALCVATP